MGFRVYPATLTTPETIAAASNGISVMLTPADIAADSLTGLDNIAVPGDPPPSGAPFQTFFIRIAMQGVAPVGPNVPTIVIQAGGGIATIVTTDSNPVSVRDAVNNEVANAFWYPADPNNVYLVKVFTFASVTWNFAIRNQDVAPRQFTWVLAGSLLDSRQPWIDILTTPLTFDAVTNQNPPPILTATVANRGTGPLTISSLSGGVAAFTAPLPVGPIAPNTSGSLPITFNPPGTIGTTGPVNYLFDSNDTTAQLTPGHNRQVQLTGTTRKLEVVLLVDASGSMPYMPNGSAVVPDPNESRWGRLKAAANQFLDLLASLDSSEGRFGVAMFPDITTGTIPAPVPSSADIQVGTDITPAAITAARNGLNAHTPVQGGGATPIGHGIGRVIGTTTTGFGYFLGSTTANAVTLNRRFLVLMSDGANNSGPPNPDAFYRTPDGGAACAGVGTAAVGTTFLDKNVRVLSVAYGDPAATTFEVDHALLTRLACKSNGQFFDAGADDAGLNLKKQFRTAIVTGLSLDPTVDPGGILTPADPEVRRQVTVTPYDTKVAFVVNWSTFDQDRVRVTLLTPTCEVITPASARDNPNILYRNHPTYAIYTFNHDFLSNAANPASPRYGTWTLIITGRFGGSDDDDVIIRANQSAIAREPYDYEVITASRLKLKLSSDRTTYYTGDVINLTAALTLDGKGIANATVTLQVTGPGQANANWLAQQKVSADEYARASERLAGEGIAKDVSAIGIKSFALTLKNVLFDAFAQTRTLQMTESATRGTYTATLSNLSTPGTYDLDVIAIGQTEDGVVFRREQRLSLRLEVRPEPKFTLFDIVYRQVIEGNQTIFFADVRVFPRDRFGNVMLIDPVVSPRLALAVRGGEPIETLQTNLDGSYGQSIRYSPGAEPVVGLAVDGVEVVPGQKTAPTTQSRYVDQVIEFKLGGEAEPGENLHREPQAVLGDVMTKPADQFVSLGADGSLTVAIQGQVIVATREDDITVFVQPDEDLRSYQVEALPAGSQSWVKLGNSSGITQSFSLAQAGLKVVSAIRITDTSGRTRNRSLEPISTPGVSLRGVGVHQTALTSDAGGCLNLLLGIPFLRWLLRLLGVVS
jgi:hypothetical protein